MNAPYSGVLVTLINSYLAISLIYFSFFHCLKGLCHAIFLLVSFYKAKTV